MNDIGHTTKGANASSKRKFEQNSTARHSKTKSEMRATSGQKQGAAIRAAIKSPRPKEEVIKICFLIETHK